VTAPDPDLTAILQAGLRAVDPGRRVAEALADEPEIGAWAGELAGAGPARTALIAVGKAALGMTRGALGVLGDAVGDGVVLAPADGAASGRPAWLPEAIELLRGGHPLPTDEGVRAAGRIAELAESLGASDRLLVLLSGGASALSSLPADGLGLADLVDTTRRLLAAGVPIEELNAVRKHLERLKGGGLARAAAPARVLGLVLSDVPGDDVAVIASGPLSPDRTSFRDVEVSLRRRGVWDELPAAVRHHLREGREGRRPDTAAAGDPAFRNVRVRVVAGGGDAVAGAALEARRRGYATHVLTRELRGEARRAGHGLARVGLAVRDGLGPVAAPACLLAAGETTVRVTGQGRGGRNQEVALAAAVALEGEGEVRVASLGTDGVDGPTDAAGAWADADTARSGRARGLDPERALADNDSHPFHEAAGTLLRTGPTGTNVADLFVVLVGRPIPAASGGSRE
jgi:hydroxypyruvate reductase